MPYWLCQLPTGCNKIKAKPKSQAAAAAAAADVAVVVAAKSQKKTCHAAAPARAALPTSTSQRAAAANDKLAETRSALLHSLHIITSGACTQSTPPSPPALLPPSNIQRLWLGQTAQPVVAARCRRQRQRRLKILGGRRLTPCRRHK